ncbi:MAG: hypothetical protein IJ057_12820 [Bacteroidales bacterium]|nr:hypothetical protein [Bacteroidales bacterium]
MPSACPSAWNITSVGSTWLSAPYLEKTFGDISEGNPNEIATIGPTLEMGGRIRLSENDRLRIGLQTSVGATLYRYSKGVDIGRIEASCLYEHWF